MKKIGFFPKASALLIVLLMIWFFVGLSNIAKSETLDGRKQLEESLRRGIVTCYAAEGAYPPSVSYLKEHYGMQIDEEKYTVFYEIYGENLMPEITVLEKK